MWDNKDHAEKTFREMLTECSSEYVMNVLLNIGVLISANEKLNLNGKVELILLADKIAAEIHPTYCFMNPDDMIEVYLE